VDCNNKQASSSIFRKLWGIFFGDSINEGQGEKGSTGGKEGGTSSGLSTKCIRQMLCGGKRIQD